MRQHQWPSSLLVVCLLLAAPACTMCGKKDSDSSDSGAGTVAAKVNTTIVPVTLTLTGIPANPAKETALNVTVTSGTGGTATEYSYALLTGVTTCAGATYSAWTDVATAITETIGADGDKLLCVLGRNDTGPTVDPTTFAWTNDVTAPVLAVTTPNFNAMGPATTAGDTTTLAGTAADATTGIAKVEVSLQRESEECLNAQKQGFLATCPTYFAATDTANWTLELNDDLFAHGYAYTLKVHAVDKVGNETTVTKTVTWDAVAPVAPYQLNVTDEAYQLGLSWPAVSDVTGYLIVRSSTSTPSFAPSAAKAYAVGDEVATGETVVYAGAGTSAVDDGLTPDTTYYYSLFAFDEAHNYSGAISASGMPFARFLGLSYFSLAGPSRLATVDWQMLDDGHSSKDDYTYKLYTGSSTGAEDFTAAAASASAKSTMLTTLSGTSSSVSAVLRATDPSSSEESNTRERSLSLSAGYHYKILGDRMFNGTVAGSARLDAPFGLAVDRWKNVIFVANTATIYALCIETTDAPYCRGRQSGRVYAIIGNDGMADSADSGAEAFTGVGNVSGVTVDTLGNIYFADQSYYKIRVQCNNIGTAAGFCAGKTRSKVYTMIGTGTIGLTANGAAIATSNMGSVISLAVDSHGNVFYGDASYGYIYGVCNVAAGTYCASKTVGKAYQVAGNGTAVYSTSGAATTTGVGYPTGIALDSAGNIFYTDQGRYTVRAVCLAASGAFCSAKTAGNSYTIAGTGSSGTGDDDADPTTTALAYPYGITVDPNDNVFFSDTNLYRVYGICYATSGNFCKSRTKGKLYVAAGTGSSADGDTGTAIGTDMSSVYAMASDAQGNLYAADYVYDRLRAVCFDGTSSGVCENKAQDSLYRIAGSGTTAAYTGSGVPAQHAQIPSIDGVVLDNKGNVYMANGTNNSIVGLCYDVTSAGTFCYGKTKGYMYTVAGKGQSWPTTGASYTASYFPYFGAITVDAFNNILVVGVSSSYEIWALCANTDGGFCSGRTAGKMYSVVGTGSYGTTANAATATAAGIGSVNALAADTYGNLVYFDGSDYRLRVVCKVTTANADNPCNGKTAGTSNYMAGTGSFGNATSTGAGTSSAMGDVYGLALDSSNNVYLADTSANAIRKYDLASTNLSVYLKRTTTGNGSDGQAMGSATLGTHGASLAFDRYGNLFFDDRSYDRIRVVCTTTSGFCSGKSTSAIYNFTATNTSGINGGSNTAAGDTTYVGVASSHNFMAIDLTGNHVYYGDNDNVVLRMFIGY